MMAQGMDPLFKEVVPVVKKKPVCKGCKLERGECPDCKQGFLEEVRKGNAPEFLEIEVLPEEAAAGQPMSIIVTVFFGPGGASDL